jgi:predicted ribonuclease YlaK
VVVVRSLVQLREVGHLPGNLEEKQEIYELPYKEICTTLFGRTDAWDRLKEQGHARFISTTAIRGISIDDAIIIVDENQNLNWSEVNTIITRVGHRSKIIFSGDFKQTDLIKSNKDQTAFHDFLEVARNMKHFQEIYFTPDDIVRSSLVKDWIISCERLGY